MTHKELVERAAVWLRRKAAVVITEMAGMGEEPDAIGFTSGESILVECKASRADFLSDKRKPYRLVPEYGVGAERFYFCPKGLIAEAELPERWGLVEVDGQKVRIRKKAEAQPRNHVMEQRLLISALRRIGLKIGEVAEFSGMSVKGYTYQTKSRATLGIATDV